jgi:hypothetical protein
LRYGSGSSEWLASLVGKDERSIWSIRALAAAFLEKKKSRLPFSVSDPDPHCFGSPGSVSVLGMRIREQGNLVKIHKMNLIFRFSK